MYFVGGPGGFVLVSGSPSGCGDISLARWALVVGLWRGAGERGGAVIALGLEGLAVVSALWGVAEACFMLHGPDRLFFVHRLGRRALLCFCLCWRSPWAVLC